MILFYKMSNTEILVTATFLINNQLILNYKFVFPLVNRTIKIRIKNLELYPLHYCIFDGLIVKISSS